MYPEYFYWQYVLAPRFLLQLDWNLQRALVRYFSVATLMKTLFAPWHRDSLPYRPGSISSIVQTFILNQLSRVIGALVRVGLLAVWLVVELVFLTSAVFSLLAFVLWPLLAVVGVATGI